MLGVLADGVLTLEEVHRFPNGPVEEGGTLRWNLEGKLLPEVRRGIAACAEKVGAPITSVGVDSWGVDFGLLGADGRLIEKPYHYRDARTEGMMDEAFRRMPKRELYERTGIQFMPINSVYQLLSVRLRNDPALARARTLVFIADLVSRDLCGRTFAEYTLASTSQMMDMRSGRWSEELLAALDLPLALLPDVIAPGAPVGTLDSAVVKGDGCDGAAVVAVGSHDTASAVVAAPAEAEDWAYISSGTWSLMGVEVPRPLINDRTFAHGFTNEGGVQNTIRLLKNISGLWLVQECRRQWAREGRDFSYADLTEMAREARPFAARLAPDDPEFLAPGDMPARINRHLMRDGQAALEDPGALVRALLENLAFCYRETLDNIEDIIGRRISVVHIVGGGAHNELLSQFAANAMNRGVVTGPFEATSIGNVLRQARALGRLDSLSDVRAVVRRSFPTKRFSPDGAAAWDDAYGKWRAQRGRDSAKEES